MMNVNSIRAAGLSLSILVFLAAGCSKNEVPEGNPVPLTLDDSARGSIEFEVPEGWVREAPRSAMRHSQYRLPGEAGDAELAVFTGIGGSAEQNIDRWINQFTDAGGNSVEGAAAVRKQQVGSLNVTYLDVSGTYNGGMGPMAGAQASLENYRLLGAVIEAPDGLWFLKLTGPEATVGKWEGSFFQFVESVRM